MSLSSPFWFAKILPKYLIAFHASNGELFHMHWYYVGIDRERKQVRWNNYPWGNIISFFSSNSSSINIALSGPSGFEYVGCTWDSFSMCLNYLKHMKLTDNPPLISKLSKRSVTGKTTLMNPVNKYQYI